MDRPSVNLWDQALKQLSDVDKRYVGVDQADKRAVLEELLKVVTEKKRICDQKQLKYTKANGQVVEVRKVLDNVVDFVKRFRDVGDAAVQYDPVHAALPWAGVRLLLQVRCLLVLFTDTTHLHIFRLQLVTARCTASWLKGFSWCLC